MTIISGSTNPTNTVIPPTATAPLLEVNNLKKYFPIRGGILSRVVANVKAVEDVSLTVKRGEVVGLVGESGSGKTTAGRAILRLIEPTSGEVKFEGTDITKISKGQMREYRKEMQIIFQDPFASLNPRMTVGDIVGEAMVIHKLARGKDKEEKVASLLEKVGLSPNHIRRYPHEFSGGQRQRIGIARALAVSPKLIVADEPVSALDVSIQAQVVNLLQDLKEELGLTLLFIAHDLAVVEYISDKVVVMYLGRVMEIAPAKELYRNPIHPYTQALLSAVPIPDPMIKRERVLLQGDIPSPINPPSGCVFRTRCPIAVKECADVVPPLEEVSPGHFKACIRRP
jgi:oligopeptide/dipeptide ABC transporter ATP-binding protein